MQVKVTIGESGNTSLVAFPLRGDIECKSSGAMVKYQLHYIVAFPLRGDIECKGLK